MHICGGSCVVSRGPGTQQCVQDDTSLGHDPSYTVTHQQLLDTSPSCHQIPKYTARYQALLDSPSPTAAAESSLIGIPS